MRFENKGVLITGGGSGIGRAVCLAFAREGANVVVADMNLEGAKATAKEAEKENGKAIAFEMNVTDPSSVRSVVQRAVAELNCIDILVNCAGIREIVPFLQLTFEEWNRVIATNITGTFLCSQFVVKHLVERGRGGKIVNVSSISGLMGLPNRAAYVSSKHAVSGFTKAMAIELGPKNIQVNAVAPGATETPKTEYLFTEEGSAASLRDSIPAGRWGQPEEVASLILFLASEEAEFITGATVPIDGGYSAGRQKKSTDVIQHV